MKKGVLIFAIILILPFVLSLDCTPKWDCSDWSECIGNKQLRICTDLNSCENAQKPALSKNCGEECAENWECTQWSVCTNSSKTRTCVDINKCNPEIKNKIETKKCPEDFNWAIYTIAGAIIILILGTIGIIWERKRRIKNKIIN